MGPSELLRHVAEALERLKIPYLVTGSMATIAYGEPRFTNDIDVVAELRREQVEAFCVEFPETEFYCSREAVLDAIKRRGQFNILHPGSGLKVDVFVPAFSAFERSRLSRGVRLPGGTHFLAWFASPEDVIIKKLEYYRQGQSDKHLRDIAGVLKVLGSRVDREYITAWAKSLNLIDEWSLVLTGEKSGGTK